MKKIKYLQKGDTIGIVSTARKISNTEIKPAIHLFESWGLHVKIGKTIGAAFNQFAGNDDLRSSDFQKMMDDEEIKAIICARGGYGTVRVIDLLDFSRFSKNPKWIVGYSDITVLHSHIHNLNIPTLHAVMPVNFKEFDQNSQTISTLKNALFGNVNEYFFKSNENNSNGTASGILVGGNLSVLYSLLGSQSDLSTKGKILFLEDLDEYIYHVDRMIINMKRNGKLSKLAGLIIGGITQMKDNEIPFGKSAEEIIKEHTMEYHYPVCFGFPSGHPPSENHALQFGSKVCLTVRDEQCSLSYI